MGVTSFLCRRTVHQLSSDRRPEPVVITFTSLVSNRYLELESSLMIVKLPSERTSGTRDFGMLSV